MNCIYNFSHFVHRYGCFLDFFTTDLCVFKDACMYLRKRYEYSTFMVYGMLLNAARGFGAGCLCVSVMTKSSLRLQYDIHAFPSNPSMIVSDIRQAVVCVDSVICKLYTVLMLSFHTSLHLLRACFHITIIPAV